MGSEVVTSGLVLPPGTQSQTIAPVATSSPAARRLAQLGSHLQTTGSSTIPAERDLKVLRTSPRTHKLGPLTEAIFALRKLGKQGGPALPDKSEQIQTPVAFVTSTRSGKFFYWAN